MLSEKAIQVDEWLEALETMGPMGVAANYLIEAFGSLGFEEAFPRYERLKKLDPDLAAVIRDNLRVRGVLREASPSLEGDDSLYKFDRNLGF